MNETPVLQPSEGAPMEQKIKLELYKKIILVLAICTIGYAASYFALGAFLTSLTLVAAVAIMNPVILYLDRLEYHTASRLIFIANLLFKINCIAWTLGNKFHLNTEISYIPIMMTSMMIFEEHEKKEFWAGVTLAISAWALARFGPVPTLPSSWGPTTFPVEAFNTLNASGTLIITAIFLNSYAEKIAKSQDLLQIANHQLEELSTRDGMTGLFNFRHFKGLLKIEHERSKRYNASYSLIFLDIDFFKKYNDRNGHPAGDRLLQKFASVVIENLRNIDIPFRYGGEEFIVICPATPKAGALMVAERIRLAIEELDFEFSKFQPRGKLTVSAGVSTYPNDALTPELLLQAADTAVYTSKEQGRNRVTPAPRS